MIIQLLSLYINCKKKNGQAEIVIHNSIVAEHKMLTLGSHLFQSKKRLLHIPILLNDM